MTKEDKELPSKVKDICTRLSYGVKGKVETTDGNGKEIKDDGVLNGVFIDEYGTVYICIEGMEYELDDVRPYLRPMESMTDEEAEEYNYLVDELSEYGCRPEQSADKMVDWLDKKMFDHRGLIPEGLALPAPEGMYISEIPKK